MLNKKLKKHLSITLTVIAIFLILLAVSTSLISAKGTTIAMANYYPQNGETYESIDHFLDQTTAINTNTTVSVSIDGEPPIPMTYQGIKNEIAPDDTVARDWHTWQITVPPITTSGSHTFQFFRHYYVWQEVDQYWAEFNSYSNIQTFNIADPTATPTEPQPPTTNPNHILTAITATAAAALLVSATLVLRKHTRQHSLPA